MALARQKHKGEALKRRLDTDLTHWDAEGKSSVRVAGNEDGGYLSALEEVDASVIGTEGLFARK